MLVEVERQVQALAPGDHLCLIYERPEEQLAAALPFIRQGLAHNECCVYIADEHTAAEIAQALTASGVDVAEEQARGALALLTKQESYLRSGEFDPLAMVELLRESTERALAAGFSAFRVTGEMAWALGPECGCRRLIEYEAYLNQFFPGSSALAICQYNRRRFSPEIIYDVLRTHSIVVVGGEVCPNPFYEHPQMVLEEPTPPCTVNWRRVDWMIGQIQRARMTEHGRQELTEQLAQKSAALESELRQRERAEALLSGQKQALERIVAGAPLRDVLETLARTAELESGSDAVAGILLLDEDGVTLRHGAAPSLPDSYNQAIDGVRIDPNLGSCAAAAARGERVIVEDIATHPNWAPIRHLPLALGLRAAWSTPIHSATGAVLGTFGIYYREPRGPSPRDLQTIEILARTASVAIECWRTEKALRESEEFNRRIIECMPDCVTVLDADAALRFMSAAGQCALEIDDLEPVRGQRWTEFWQGEERQAAEGAVAAALDGEVGRFQGHFPTRKSGERKWWDVVITPIRDAGGRTERLLAISRDVTAHRQAEEALRRSHRRLGLLTETAIDVLRGGTPQEFLSAVYGRLEAELGLEVFFHYQLPPGGDTLELTAHHGVTEACAASISRLPLGVAVCGRVALCGRPIVAEQILESTAPETELVRSLGITAYACHPLSVSGVLLGTLSFGTRRRDRFSPEEVGLMRAVSDQVAAAIQRGRLERELQHRAESLAEADRRKDEFLAMLAHELRNPLAPILTASQLLQERGAEEEIVRRQGTVIERSSRHLSRLVDDLLEVSRINEGKIELRRESVDLSSVAQQAATGALALMEAHRHTFTVSLPEERTPVDADPTRLIQVAVNLLNNAAKYTDPGGEVVLTVRREGESALLSVRDNGCGIEPQLLSRVFDLFVQGRQSLARTEGGLGIGLTLVQRLVELHGGTVQARSEGPGLGSEVVVCLPLLSEPTVPAEDLVPAAPRAGRSPRRVLLVEDNRDAAETLAELLEYWGHRVLVAFDGHGALEAVPEFLPEVVLLDLGLPGMTGYEVASHLRAGAEGGPRLVALTGYGDGDSRRRVQEAGFDHHLTKPVEPEALRTLLATELA